MSLRLGTLNIGYDASVDIKGGPYKKIFDITKSARHIFHKVTEMTSEQLEQILFYFDTSNVTDMISMFSECHALTTVPPLDTSKVTKMISMFLDCYHLTNIPLLDTSNVTDMSNMFLDCNSLTTIPPLDTSKVRNMDNMFRRCRSLTEIHMTGMKVSFDISASTLFTREALLEIIGNLSTISTTQTLTMGSANLAKLTNEDIAIATNKGWTLA